jgi:hypothetical protein
MVEHLDHVEGAEIGCRDNAVHLLLAGDIGCRGKDAPVRLGRQLSRRRLQIRLVPGHDRHIDTSRANSRAMALSMPRLPPGTIACLSCNPRATAFSPVSQRYVT